MAGYRLSAKADADVAEIYTFSIATFGLAVARDYFRDLHKAFDLLAANPMMGRAVGDHRPGLRQLAHQSHVIYYRARKNGAFIMRVLHSSRSAEAYLM